MNLAYSTRSALRRAFSTSQVASTSASTSTSNHPRSVSNPYNQHGKFDDERTIVQLVGLPPTAIPADIRRLATRAHVPYSQYDGVSALWIIRLFFALCISSDIGLIQFN